MAAKEIIPAFVREQFGGTTRDFKQAKRAELDRALRALSEFQHASAWLPEEAYRTYDQAHAKLLEVREMLTLENWGR